MYRPQTYVVDGPHQLLSITISPAATLRQPAAKKTPTRLNFWDTAGFSYLFLFAFFFLFSSSPFSFTPHFFTSSLPFFSSLYSSSCRPFPVLPFYLSIDFSFIQPIRMSSTFPLPQECLEAIIHILGRVQGVGSFATMLRVNKYVCSITLPILYGAVPFSVLNGYYPKDSPAFKRRQMLIATLLLGVPKNRITDFLRVTFLQDSVDDQEHPPYALCFVPFVCDRDFVDRLQQRLLRRLLPGRWPSRGLL